jgi:DNA-binding NtrC family response regulator
MATFQLLDANGQVRGTVDLEAEELVLGRDLIARLGGGADPSVSRRHARVRRDGSALVIEDLGSRNGTLLNGGRIVGAARLAAGDVIEVGEQRFRYVGELLIEERSAPVVYDGVTQAATRAGAPERLRLVYDLTRIAAQSLSPAEVGRRLHAILERTLRPETIAVWLAGSAQPVAGKSQGAPIAYDLLVERVLEGGQALRVPGGSAPAVALGLPLSADREGVGMVLIATGPGRPLSEDDVNFAFAAAALAGEALRRASRVSALVLESGEDEIVGESAGIVRAKREVDLVAPYEDLSVLLAGETGTGKELFARRVHRASRRAGPFVAVNVAALPSELLESELFGHAKGAFTGAVSARVGYVEYASGGTLFLDEIGEMPAPLQAKLLRVLQEKKIHRVGDPRPVEVDVRLVAATNADLPARIQAGAFREDLYYRIAGKEIRIPPLREREGDIPLLVQAFLRRSTGRSPQPVRAVSAEAMGLFTAYPWPGNVRQLEGTVRLAVIHASAEGASEIGPEHVDERVRVASASRPAPGSLAEELAEAERRIVVKALRASAGNKREAARLLGWSINTLRDRVERYGITETELS